MFFARVPHTNYAWQGIIRLIKTTNRISHRPLFRADQLGADVLRPRSGPVRSKRRFAWCCMRHCPTLSSAFGEVEKSVAWTQMRRLSVPKVPPQAPQWSPSSLTGSQTRCSQCFPPPPSCVSDPFLCGMNKETSLFMLNSWSMPQKRQSEHLQPTLEQTRSREKRFSSLTVRLNPWQPKHSQKNHRTAQKNQRRL